MGPQLTIQPGMMNGPGMMGPSMAIPIQPGMMNGPGMMDPGMGMTAWYDERSRNDYGTPGHLNAKRQRINEKTPYLSF